MTQEERIRELEAKVNELKIEQRHNRTNGFKMLEVIYSVAVMVMTGRGSDQAGFDRALQSFDKATDELVEALRADNNE